MATYSTIAAAIAANASQADTDAAADAQFDANGNWYGSQAAAKLRLEAVEYKLFHRAQRAGDQNQTYEFESLEKQAETLRAFLGASVPRAFGRSRRVFAGFSGRSGIS